MSDVVRVELDHSLPQPVSDQNGVRRESRVALPEHRLRHFRRHSDVLSLAERHVLRYLGDIPVNVESTQ